MNERIEALVELAKTVGLEELMVVASMEATAEEWMEVARRMM